MARPDLNGLERFRKTLGHVGVNAVVHQDAGNGGALLARHDHGPAHNGRNGGVQVGIGQDNGGRFAAQLQRQALERARRALGNELAHVGRAGEAEHLHIGVGAKGLRHHTSGFHHRVDDAGRHARIGQTLQHDVVNERGLVRGLDDTGAARRHGGAKRADQQGHRRIPRQDDGAHARGLTLHGAVATGLNFQHAAVDVAGQACVITHFGNAGIDFAQRLTAQFTVKGDQPIGHFVAARLHAGGHVHHDVGTQARAVLPSGVLKRMHGRSNGSVRVGGGAFCKLSGHFTGGRVVARG